MVSQPNRRIRRATQQGIPPKPAPGFRQEIPPNARLRLFTDLSPTVTIGPDTRRVAKFTTAGVANLETWIEQHWMDFLVDANTVGDQLVRSAMSVHRFDLLYELFERILEEPLSELTVYECDPDEMAAAINQFRESSGLKWLEDTLKNYVRQRQSLTSNLMDNLGNPEVMKLLMSFANEQGGTDASQESSTTSSDTLPESLTDLIQRTPSTTTPSGG